MERAVYGISLDIVHNEQRRARRISIGTMGLTVLFMVCMLRTMHTALRDIRAKDASGAGDSAEGRETHNDKGYHNV